MTIFLAAGFLVWTIDPMTRIDSFKNATEVTALFERNARSTSKYGRANVTLVRDSLVGATQNLNNRVGTTYTYEDGRTCKHPDGARHDCSYVDARNRLIPAAIMNAGRVVFPDGDPTGSRRAVEFLREMDRLWEGRSK
jgi:hypothetical protein